MRITRVDAAAGENGPNKLKNFALSPQHEAGIDAGEVKCNRARAELPRRYLLRRDGAPDFSQER
jgi:hypothetical protein